MGVDIKNLIAAINPDIYCENSVDEYGVLLRKKVKDIVKQDGFLKAAEKAKLVSSSYIDVAHTQFTKGAFKLEGLKNPVERHILIHDAPMKGMEEVYFWILDFVNGIYGSTEKLVDNFVASPGSGHFAEMQARATRMQEEGMKIFGAVNTVMKSVLNLIYDLKEFKLRILEYDNLKSGEPGRKTAALLALKQRWLDNVDIKRGNSSIKGFAQQFDYVTLIDAFMAGELKNVDKLDLNDRVKRILQQRLGEFESWLIESEKELRKRYEIERLYLKSQVNSLKLYARWAKPYLDAAKKLEQNATATADIVNAFNTTLFELAILAKGKYEVKDDVAKGQLPKFFKKLKMRKYYPMTLIEFNFRTIPERGDQRGGYNFIGRVKVEFTSFSFNDDELKIFREKVDEGNLGDMYKIVEGLTDGSIAQVNDDINELLGDSQPKEKEDKKSEDSNPFSALFSIFKSEKKEEEKSDLSKGIPKDGEYEKVARSQASLSARDKCRKVYDTYKKTHGMVAFEPVISFA